MSVAAGQALKSDKAREAAKNTWVMSEAIARKEQSSRIMGKGVQEENQGGDLSQFLGFCTGQDEEEE